MRIMEKNHKVLVVIRNSQISFKALLLMSNAFLFTDAYLFDDSGKNKNLIKKSNFSPRDKLRFLIFEYFLKFLDYLIGLKRKKVFNESKSLQNIKFTSLLETITPLNHEIILDFQPSRKNLIMPYFKSPVLIIKSESKFDFFSPLFVTDIWLQKKPILICNFQIKKGTQITNLESCVIENNLSFLIFQLNCRNEIIVSLVEILNRSSNAKILT